MSIEDWDPVKTWNGMLCFIVYIAAEQMTKDCCPVSNIGTTHTDNVNVYLISVRLNQQQFLSFRGFAVESLN